MEGFILNGEHAARWTRYGLYIYPYFRDEGKVLEDVYGGHVTLDQAALQTLAAETCAEYGPCDRLEEAQEHIASLQTVLEALLQAGESGLMSEWYPIAQQARDALVPERREG